MEHTIHFQGIVPEKTIEISSIGQMLDSLIVQHRVIVASNHFPAFLYFSSNTPNMRVLDLYALFEQLDKQTKVATKPIHRRRPLLSRRLRRPTTAVGAVSKASSPKPPDPIPKSVSEQTPKEKRLTLGDIFQKYVTLYSLDLLTFLDLYFFYQIHSSPWSKKSDFRTFTGIFQSLILSIEDYSQFGDHYIISYGTHIKERPQIIKFLNDRYLSQSSTNSQGIRVNTWYSTRLHDMEFQKKKIHDKVEQVDRQLHQLDTLAVLEPVQEQIVGKIQSFFLDNVPETAGQLFNQVQVNDHYPKCRYKSFWKLWIYPNPTLVEDPEDTDSVDSHLKIFDASGRLTFVIKTEAKGLYVQGLFLRSSPLSNPTLLLDFLHLSSSLSLHRIRSLGVMSEFLLPTHRSMDPSIFADICMNQPLFQRFFKVNDTEKISRNNQSLFIYYYNQDELHPTQLQDEIMVGGWNRVFSRYGDLTCILTPLRSQKRLFYVHVKITRSKEESIVLQFKQLLGKLISYYNETLSMYVSKFKQWDPSFQLYEPFPQELSSDISLTDQWKDKVFGSNEYTRACQAPKPRVISESEARQYPSTRTLQFPPKPFQNIQPQWFLCDEQWKGKHYHYPGLIQLSNPENVFGYAPCCYIESHESKNQAILHKLNYLIEHHHKEDFVKSIPLTSLLKTKRRMLDSTKRTIQQIGQEGLLDPSIVHFMKSIQVSFQYTRMGTSPWEKESFLGALEFIHAIQSPEKTMRSPQQLRALLNEQHFLETGLQQNFDRGIQGMRLALSDPSQELHPRHWIRVLEEFYQKNIWIFIQKESAKKESLELFYPFTFGAYAYPLLSQCKQRDMVFLVEHQSPSSLIASRFEIIVSKVSSSNIHYTMPFQSSFKSMIQDSMKCFSGNQIIPWPSHSFVTKHYSEIQAQQIDLYGKTRILCFRNNLVALLSLPISPLPFPLIELSSHPNHFISHSLQTFLSTQKIRIKQTLSVHQWRFVFLSHDPIILVSVSKGSPSSSSDTQPIPLCIRIFLNLIKPSNQYSLIEQKSRLIHILLDLCLLHLSEFVHSLSPSTMPPKEMIRTFMNTHFDFRVHYQFPEMSQLSPRKSLNSILYTKDRRLILLQTMRTKLRFFLEWFFLTKPQTFANYHSFHEIPSFYLFSSDFQSQPRTVIQTKYDYYISHSSTPYLSTPLSSLDIPMFIPLYYYCPKETPSPIFYRVLLSFTYEEGQSFIQTFFTQYDFKSSLTTLEWIQRPWSSSSSRLTPIYCFQTQQNHYGFLFNLPDS